MITTRDRVKQRAEVTQATFDRPIDEILEGLTTLFERQTNRTLLRAEGIVALFDGGRVIFGPLPALLIEGITEIKEDANPVDFTAAVALVDGTDFIADPNGGLIRRLPSGRRWQGGFRNVRVTYTGGYVAPGTPLMVGQTAMPDDLQEAATMQAVHYVKNRDRLGATSISADGASIALSPAELLPAVRQILKGYRRYPL